jgi:hypothetical protein
VARGEVLQQFEYLGTEEIPSDQTKIGGGPFLAGLLHCSVDIEYSIHLLRSGDDHPVAGQELVGKASQADSRLAFGRGEERRQDIVAGTDNVVGQETEEGTVAHGLRRLEDRMAQTQRLLLDHHPYLDPLQPR